MALSLGPVSFGNPSGLWALLGLVPLIILYLIRPRPKQVQIPSLMFFLKSTGTRKLSSFLRHFTKDWLFLIQLFALLALSLTFSEPVTKYQHDITASNTVIVLDASASSQTQEGIRTRFALEVAEAKKVLGQKNTVILAKDAPFLALKDATPEETTRFLNALSPKSTVSRIGEAVILAGETIPEGRVVVISDFINTAGQDPEIAKKVLESKGLVVDFVNIASTNRKNIGIIQLDAGNEQSVVYVKNYNDASKSIELAVGSTKTRLAMPPKGIETYSFKTPEGITKIELLENDDLPADNVAYLSAPEGGRAKILFVHNNESVFLKNALLASGDFEVAITEPPIITEGVFDVIIISDIDVKQLLPGTFEELAEKAEKGATVIVAVQDNSAEIDYKGLLPVKLTGKVDGGFVSTEQLNRFTKNIDFGKIDYTMFAQPIGEQAVIAAVNKIPVLTIKPYGKGKIVYYGIPEAGDFRYSPHYPIFWTEFAKFLTSHQDVKNLNFKTGETLLLDKEEKIKTPTRTVKKAAIVLDEAGIYELENRIIAVNIVDQLESGINAEKKAGTKSIEYELKPVKETREFHVTLLLLAIALLLVLFEVFFANYRGDI